MLELIWSFCHIIDDWNWYLSKIFIQDTSITNIQSHYMVIKFPHSFRNYILIVEELWDTCNSFIKEITSMTVISKAEINWFFQNCFEGRIKFWEFAMDGLKNSSNCSHKSLCSQTHFSINIILLAIFATFNKSTKGVLEFDAKWLSIWCNFIFKCINDSSECDDQIFKIDFIHNLKIYFQDFPKTWSYKINGWFLMLKENWNCNSCFNFDSIVWTPKELDDFIKSSAHVVLVSEIKLSILSVNRTCSRLH